MTHSFSYIFNLYLFFVLTGIKEFNLWRETFHLLFSMCIRHISENYRFLWTNELIHLITRINKKKKEIAIIRENKNVFVYLISFDWMKIGRREILFLGWKTRTTWEIHSYFKFELHSYLFLSQNIYFSPLKSKYVEKIIFSSLMRCLITHHFLKN